MELKYVATAGVIHGIVRYVKAMEADVNPSAVQMSIVMMEDVSPLAAPKIQIVPLSNIVVQTLLLRIVLGTSNINVLNVLKIITANTLIVKNVNMGNV